MKNLYSQKLLYKHYVYKLKLELPFDEKGATKIQHAEFVKKIQIWLDRYHKDTQRVTVSWSSKRVNYVDDNNKKRQKVKRICKMLIYIKDKKTFQKIYKKYSPHVIEATAPANAAHEDLIRQGCILEVRSKLFYGEYRYKITFKRSYNEETIDTVYETLRNSVHDENVIDQSYNMNKHNATVYLKHNDDLMAIKLSIGELIDDVIVIALDSELITHYSLKLSIDKYQ